MSTVAADGVGTFVNEKQPRQVPTGGCVKAAGQPIFGPSAIAGRLFTEGRPESGPVPCFPIRPALRRTFLGCPGTKNPTPDSVGNS